MTNGMVTDASAYSLDAYDYELPPDLIAQHPEKKRTASRLMVVRRDTGDYSHHTFSEIGNFLKAGDLLVLNDTKVIPARLIGRKETGAKVEILLLREIDTNRWEALIKPSLRVREGTPVFFGDESEGFSLTVYGPAAGGSAGRVVEFSGASYRDDLQKIGHMPLPPYIRRPGEPSDRERYQTVFARKEGAVAAPTAGLHFDEDLLGALAAQGVETAFVTLHTGYGTFRPIQNEDIRSHRMFEELFEIPEDTAEKINRAKGENRRVIACGTTSVRALESAADSKRRVAPCRERTGLFIYPPYAFRIVDGLITNFHFPKSTLLVLVSAFLGREKLLNAYKEAVREQYRFFSYGDAMFMI